MTSIQLTTFTTSRPSDGETEDDDDYDVDDLSLVTSARHLLVRPNSRDHFPGSDNEDEIDGGGRRGSRGRTDDHAAPAPDPGTLGYFLSHSALGWQLGMITLILTLGGAELGGFLLNRTVLQSGVWRFPYPLTLTLFQVLFTHIALVLVERVLRALRQPLSQIGFTGLVASAKSNRRSPESQNLSLQDTAKRYALSAWMNSKWMLPLAAIYVAKLILSNLALAYTILPTYTLARIHTIPLTLLFTSYINQTTHSVPTLSATLTGVMYLLVATARSGPPVSWDSIATAMASSVAVALYPAVLHRVLTKPISTRSATSNSASALDAFTTYTTTNRTAHHRSNAFVPPSPGAHWWNTMHTLSLLSVIILTILVLLSGELPLIHRNCYILDVPRFWIPVIGAAATGTVVFMLTPLLVRHASPITTAFLLVPRSALQLVLVQHRHTPLRCWVGIAMCAVSCVWYLQVRRRESRRLQILRAGPGW